MGSLYERIRGREGLGFGDVKMVAVMGAFLGLETSMMAVLGASAVGAVLGGLWIVLRGKKASDEHLPFGSFLGVAALAAGWLA